MEPRELDYLVATKVMGLQIPLITDPDERALRANPPDGESPECDAKTGVWWSCPYYSSDMGTAWKIVAHMLEGDNAPDFGTALLDVSGGRKCTTYADMVCAVLDTMTPENICKAALRALGIPVEGGE